MNSPKTDQQSKEKYRKTKEEINAEGRERKREKNIAGISLVAVIKTSLQMVKKMDKMFRLTHVLAVKTHSINCGR